MSNFLSPPERDPNGSRYPENFFLDTTKETLEERGFLASSAQDPNGSEILHVSLPGNDAFIYVRVNPNDSTLYVNSETDLRVLRRSLG